MTIEETQAYKNLPLISQQMVLKRANRLQIEDAVIQARTIGLQRWKQITPLQERWKAIVVEIVENK